MNQQIADKIGNALIEAGSNLKAGTSEITEEQALDIMSIVAHIPISREEVCLEMNISNDKFYDLLARKKIPNGRKRRGFKELCWYRDEIIAALNKLKRKD